MPLTGAAPTSRPTAAELAALHHPVRRRLLEHLTVEGPATVGTLADALGQQVGSISHHVKILEREGFAVPAPELARDRRESWWRSVPRRLSWSVGDFADSPGDELLATAAERANLEHHVDKVLQWFTAREGFDPAWQQAAFATEHWAHATAAELADLSRRLDEVLRDWADACEAGRARESETGDDEALARRHPVFVSAHGNPARP